MRISNEINKNQQNMNKTFWIFYLIYHNLNKKRTLTLFFNIQLFAGKLISNKNKNPLKNIEKCQNQITTVILIMA